MNPRFLSLPVLAGAFLLSGCGTLQKSGDAEEAADRSKPGPMATQMLLEPPLASDVVEPSPAEPAGGSGDLWARMREGFAMELDRDNPRIRSQRDWYARNQAYLDRVAERGKRYLHHIVEEAEKRDMPLELALLPVVESAFDPFAYSHGRAAGTWQFIQSTGEHFGMTQDFWHDGRRDILQSTDAALTYLQQLANRFDGDWKLALASYNAGAGTVSRAIRRNSRAGQATDYWSLRLPRETMAYVPKLIGLAQIIREPEAYDISLKPIADEPYFDVVEMDYQIDMAEAAELSGVSVEELYMLNPHINRWATPPGGPHRLLVPVDQAEPFREKLAEVPARERMRWEEYTIRSGDTLGAIARRYNTTAEMIRETNDLRGNTIVAGRTLLLPSPSGKSGDYSLSADERLAAQQNRSRSGRQQIRHRVQPGETLWELGRKYGVGVRELASTNNMAPGDTLRVGQEIAVWTDRADIGQGTIEGQPDMVRRIRYAVRRGDSLYRIANRFNVAVNEIINWNGIDRNGYLHPGDRLELYVDVRDVQ